MRKKLLSMILSVSMMLAMAPMSVMAEDVIDTEEELVAALEAGGEVTLGGDIELYSQVEVDTDLHLDLNGHTITLSVDMENYSYGVIQIGNNSSCNTLIEDTVGGGGILAGESGSMVFHYYDGNHTVDSGAYSFIGIMGGNINLGDVTVERAYVDSSRNVPTVNVSDDTVVDQWHIYDGVFNFEAGRPYFRLGEWRKELALPMLQVCAELGKMMIGEDWKEEDK